MNRPEKEVFTFVKRTRNKILFRETDHTTEKARQKRTERSKSAKIEKSDRRPFVKPVLTKHEQLNQVTRFGVGGVSGVVTVPFLS
ncbi:hypothetical protein ACFL4G_10940 [Thermodesulfobacteriota bacterium]